MISIIKPTGCKHERFKSEVNVQRVEDLPGEFVVNLHLACGQCGIPFVFRGQSKGAGLAGASELYSSDGTEARLFIRPML